MPRVIMLKAALQGLLQCGFAVYGDKENMRLFFKLIEPAPLLYGIRHFFVDLVKRYEPDTAVEPL